MIGILSLQGNFAEHYDQLHKHGLEAIQVRTVADLAKVDGLVIPGGESTTIGKLLVLTGLDKEIKLKFKNGELKIWGTCAGAILCASKIVTDNPVEHLDLGDYTVERNAYGNQLESFETEIEMLDFKVKVAFIRAPKILEFGEGFEVLSELDEQPVMIKKGGLLISTFHPELFENEKFYEWLEAWFKS